MKYLIAFLLATTSAFGATVTGPVGDLTGGAFNPRVEFWPLSTPLNSGNTNIVGPMKSVAVVSGNFSQVFVAGTYRVCFPPTTNCITIHVPNDTGTYSLAALSTNVSSVTGVVTTPAYRVKVTSADTNASFLSSKLVAGSNITITTNNAGQNETLTITTASGGTSGALTNNETRAVTFADDVTITGVATATSLSVSTIGAGAVTAGSFIGTGAAVTQLSGDNIATGTVADARIASTITRDSELVAADTVVSNGIITGLAAGSYPIKVSALTSGNLTNFGFTVTNTTRGDAYRSFGLDTNGYFVSAYNNADRVGDEPGYNFRDVSGNTMGSIGVWMDHGGAPDTPEAIFAFDGNIAFLQARDGEPNKNIQLGRNAYSSGFINVGYGTADTSNGLSSVTSGHSQRQVFPAIGPAGNYAYPGFIGYWRTASGGMGGFGLGGIKIFDLVPLWTGGGFSALQGVETLDVSKAGIVAAPSVPFIGSGSGITNQNYALFTRQLAAGTTIPTVPSGAWTNVLFTTNSTGGTSFDSASGFTLSNSFIIVNAAGAGRWKARGRAVIYNNTDNTGAVLMALYRYSPSATELGYGDCVYQTGFTSPTAQLACTIDLAAGDIIGLRIFPAGTSNTQIGRSISAGIPFTVGALELERQ